MELKLIFPLLIIEKYLKLATDTTSSKLNSAVAVYALQSLN
jgi:hypothetical protein